MIHIPAPWYKFNSYLLIIYNIKKKNVKHKRVINYISKIPISYEGYSLPIGFIFIYLFPKFQIPFMCKHIGHVEQYNFPF